MRIELAWVGEDGSVRLRHLELPIGTNLGEALAAIDEPRLREALGAGRLSAAVFGKVRRPEEPLFEGDRIELVEALRIDPKIARQRRVAVRREQAARARRGRGS
jgi:putative ubiquitin-RnfH superfamily antitoxin RatB of RatAB toxin-antitoxin module